MSTSPVISDGVEDPVSEILAPNSTILPSLYDLLPMPEVNLTQSESQVVEKYQLGRTLIGPVAAAVMSCPPPLPESLEGEQGSLTMMNLYTKHKCCPYAKSCPLLKVDKAPHGEPCPLETTYILERFIRWTHELGKEPTTLTETDRVAASELTSIDLSEHRCLSILGEAENARLTDISVKETANNGDPLAYEKVIHINQQVLDSIRNQRRKILHDYELTPEMKTKKAKYETGEKGLDLSSLQSARADKFKKALEARAGKAPTEM